MVYRYRPMQPRDVRECVQLLAEHPVLGPRYGSTIADVGTAWLRLLGQEALLTSVFEEVEGGGTRVWGVGVSAVVREEVLTELKKPPLQWTGPELTKRVMSGNSPLLSDRELREQNVRGGLTLIVWAGYMRAGDEKRPELMQQIMRGFLETHRGYLWRELISHQQESPERLEWTLHSGARVWDAQRGQYLENPGEDLATIAREPHLVGVTREIARTRLSAWVDVLFEHELPRFGVSHAEQQLLLAVLGGSGMTDPELAKVLHVSVATVKKMWASIYRRVMEREPGILPDCTWLEKGLSERGKEKRRRLLTYLREHPEELRPVPNGQRASTQNAATNQRRAS
ncbi:MAG TPA: hypothetical protein VHX37_03405 [Acidobacteriaceae bacterium]|jgi:hypothetical protein|nr:hypothetical protein [Acidobacteriaceae bacterium]